MLAASDWPSTCILEYRWKRAIPTPAVKHFEKYECITTSVSSEEEGYMLNPSLLTQTA